MATGFINITGSAVKVFEKLRKSRGVERKKLYATVFTIFSKQGKLAAGHVIRTQLSGNLGPSPSGVANKQAKKRRSGNLARTITGGAKMVQGVPAMVVGVFRGPAATYAGPQEFGTQGINPDSPYKTIRPVKAKALAMPVSPKVLTPTGVARYSSPRQFPQPLAFIPIRGGHGGRKGNVVGRLVLQKKLREIRVSAILGESIHDSRGRFARAQKAISDLETIYLLLSKMDIPPGFFITDGVQDYLPQVVQALVNGIFNELFGEGEKVST